MGSRRTSILTVVGARPQFVKAAVVSRALAAAGLGETILHTGQHHDPGLSDVFFAELDIPAPKHHLGISGGTHGEMTGRMIAAIERVLLDERPDWVLVYGDTNSTLAGALAASKLKLRVAHVEAGLRSFDRSMPEEINRIVTDHLSDLLFAPSAAAKRNLAAEGRPAAAVLRVGDVMLDAWRENAGRADRGVIERIGARAGAYVLATVHRAENTDDPVRLRAILDGLGRVAATMPVVLPLHPRTRKAIGVAEAPARGLHLIDPVPYLSMLALEREAAVIATDSGGVQKEAYFAGVPCVTLRDGTEWVELIEHGWNRLCPPSSSDAIATAVLAAVGSVGDPTPLYGDGDASSKIASALSRIP
jgi:UDP-GlcNAc3NAcA epimerase